MVIRREDYPHVHRAMQLVVLDNVGPLKMLPREFHVPDSMAAQVDNADMALATLSAEQLETFAFGERTDVEMLITTPALVEADVLLTTWFNNGMD